VASPSKSPATQTTAAAIDAFAADLYAHLAGQSGNLAFSPFSIETALAMIYAGAGGQTAKEMAAVLHLGPNNAATQAAYGALLRQIAADGNAPGSELDVADSLWGQSGYPFAPGFLQVLQNDYGAALNRADFAGAPEQARAAVNAWVAQQTHGKITDLFPPGSLTPATRLVLANALYFKGAWAQPFDPADTYGGTFLVAPGQTVSASMMHQTATFGYAHRDGVQTLEMAYANSHLVMDVLLPDQAGGLANLERQLTPANLAAWTSGLRQQRVAVTLPKFQVTGAFSLSQALSAMGMPSAFSGHANFSGLNNGRDPLQISAVLHKAYVAVGEQGTEAAAATGVGVSTAVVGATRTAAQVFNADHPFVYVIRDTSTNAVLFMGRISNPGV
jgi:serpin B